MSKPPGGGWEDSMVIPTSSGVIAQGGLYLDAGRGDFTITFDDSTIILYTSVTGPRPVTVSDDMEAPTLLNTFEANDALKAVFGLKPCNPTL